MTDGSGRRLSAPFAIFDPDSCSWRTSQLSLTGDLDEFSEGWPASGMTVAGAAYALATPERPTSESAGSLLPTPTASLQAPAPWKEGVDWWLQSRATRNLWGVVSGNTPLLPTPVARDYKGVPGDNVQMASLPREVMLLPTPRAREGTFGVENTDNYLDRRQRRRKNPRTAQEKNYSGVPLMTAIETGGDYSSPRSGDGSTSPADVPLFP